MTTPTATANPYAPTVVVPVVHTSTGSAAMPATVSTVTSSSVIADGAQRTAAHNALVLAQAGRKVSGGSKSNRKRSKRSTKRSKRSKRSTKRSKRRRGGNPTPSPKPSVMPVPQFVGAHNAGANANSLASNRVLTDAAAKSVYDNPNAPASNTKVV